MNVGKAKSKATQVTVIKNSSDSNLCFIIINFSLCTFCKEQTELVKHRTVCLFLQFHQLNQLRDFHKLGMNYVEITKTLHCLLSYNQQQQQQQQQQQ